jgi:tetratricopeptide (TPR) repeat protein
LSVPLGGDRRADPLVARAVAQVAGGDVAGALATWASAPSSATANVGDRTAQLLATIEGRRRIAQAPPSRLPDEPENTAWALAWAGDLDAARRVAEALPEGPQTWGLLGVIAVLQRRSAAAIDLLDRAVEDGLGEPFVLHRARALVHLGRISEAERALAHLADGESFSRRMLKALVSVRRGVLLPTFRRWCHRVAGSEYLYNGLFSTELPGLVGADAMRRAFESPEALATLLDDLLDRMAGNLGPSPTFAERTPDGRRRYVRVELPTLPRTAAVDALYSLRFLDAGDVEGALTRLVVQRRSAHSHTYRGELYLWLGRYDAAWRDFVAARRIESVRWADVGMLAVLTLTGRLRGARLMALYAKHHFPSIPGGTLPVYRGVLRRRLGDLEGAVTDLRSALAAKPERLGARMELCLALRAGGRATEAADHAAVLLREAAPLLVDRATALGVDWRAQPAYLTEDAVLEEALRAMRGNRSSNLVTWFDRAGGLRVLTPLAVLQEHARQIDGHATAPGAGRRLG